MEFKPRNYRNLRWQILPRNKIDTVTMSPISNSIPEKPEVYYTEKFTEGTVNGAAVTFPVEDAFIDTNYHRLYNRYLRPIYGKNTFAKGYVGCVMARGSKDVYVSTAVSGNVEAQIALTGTSAEVGRGGSTFNSFPDESEMIPNVNYRLAQWIKQHASATENSLKWSYMDNRFSLNPFVRNFVPLDLGNLPTPNDIVTDWWKFKTGCVGTNASGWYENGTSIEDLQQQRMYATDSRGLYDDPLGLTTVIILRDLQGLIKCNAIRLDDHNYRITWEAPIRLCYLAASRYQDLSGTFYDVDNYALCDNVTQIEVSLIGRQFSTEVVEKSYSMSGGQLTDQVTNQYPYKIDAGEFLTLDSKYDGASWIDTIAVGLLDSYDQGKYVVTLDVTARWAIQNTLGIRGTLHTIYKQDGAPIMRYKKPCQFYLCNITKKFKANEFVYSLGFVEV